ncbi:hypothetical protein HQ585_16295 [candidate division KSB1 bacterium]|nr:hypothetical protein [candidate division KSB1 bacterium]
MKTKHLNIIFLITLLSGVWALDDNSEVLSILVPLQETENVIPFIFSFKDNANPAMNPFAELTTNFHLTVFSGRVGSVLGLQISGLISHVKYDFTGYDATGISSTIGGDFSGFQTTGISNKITGSFIGIQDVGISNTVKQPLSGMQIAGVVQTRTGADIRQFSEDETEYSQFFGLQF